MNPQVYFVVAKLKSSVKRNVGARDCLTTDWSGWLPDAFGRFVPSSLDNRDIDLVVDRFQSMSMQLRGQQGSRRARPMPFLKPTAVVKPYHHVCRCGTGIVWKRGVIAKSGRPG